MRRLNFFKNLAITLLIVSWYAFWCRENLKTLTPVHTALILICVGGLILRLLVWIDRQIKKIDKERKLKNGKN